MTVVIALPNGKRTLVDSADLGLVAAFRWRASRSTQTEEKFYVYAYRKKKILYLHRFLMGEPTGLQIDHINGDTLDNRRCNLRLATRAENNVNRSYANATGFRGVNRNGSRFRAYISSRLLTGKKHINLGSFETAEEAAKAYDEAAFRRWGSFARLNFSQEEHA